MFDKAKEIFLNQYSIHSIAKKEAKHELACALVDEMEPGLDYRVQMIERTFPQFNFGSSPDEKYAVRIKADVIPTRIYNPSLCGNTADVITADDIKGVLNDIDYIYKTFVPAEPLLHLTQKQLNHYYQTYLPEPKTVIFNPPATIVYWEDGEKTIVKCMEGDEFNPEVGLAMCLAKYIFGGRYKRWFKDALKKGGWEDD